MASTQTEEIKERLADYTAMLRHIDNQIERLERLEATIGSPSTPNLSGMPSGGGDGTSKIERQVVRKLELEENIKAAIQRERAEYKELAAMVEQMKNPDERLVIEMRYFDREDWPSICEALYCGQVDFTEKLEKYTRKAYSVHGSALLSLSYIMEPTKE